MNGDSSINRIRLRKYREEQIEALTTDIAENSRGKFGDLNNGQIAQRLVDIGWRNEPNGMSIQERFDD